MSYAECKLYSDVVAVLLLKVKILLYMSYTACTLQPDAFAVHEAPGDEGEHFVLDRSYAVCIL